MPSLLNEYNEKNKYLHRMVPIKAVRALVPVLKNAEVKTVIKVVLEACKDSISNVRLLAVQALNDIIPKLDDTEINKDIRPILEPMLKDGDDDVKFFATMALKTASER